MKISLEAQVFGNRSLTGVGWYAYYIIKNIINNDFENNYYLNCFDFLSRNKTGRKVSEMFSNNKVNVNICNLIPFGAFMRMQDVMRIVPYETLFGIKCDISHFFNYVIPRNIRSKTIVTVHDMVLKRYPETMSDTNFKILNKNLERSCMYSDIIITSSENSRKEICDFMNVSKEKVEVVYCSRDEELYNPIDKSKCIDVLKKYNINRKYVLYTGTLEPRKNIEGLLKAFHIFSIKNKNVDLVIVGNKGWKYEEIFSLVQKLELHEKVIFTGYLEQSEMPKIYSCAEFFVFPSFYEGFGIPPLEAMACGIPVIVSNSSSLPEVVGDAGILVDPYNIENIAYEMDRLYNDVELREIISKKGLLQANKFSWKDSAWKILKIYNKVGEFCE